MALIFADADPGVPIGRPSEASSMHFKASAKGKLQEKIVFIKEDSKAPHKLKFVLD